MHGQLIDITDESSRLAGVLLAVVEKAPDCIVALDQTGRISYANSAAELLFGCISSELLGAHVLDVMCACSLPRHRGEPDIQYLARLGRLATSGGRVPVGVIRPDGAMRQVRVSISPLPQKDSASFVCYLSEIDERRQEVDLVEERRTEPNAGMEAVRRRFASLTRREREVMALVTLGLRNKQVAWELGISEITVKSHRGKVMRKMHAASLVQLVNLSRLVGLSSARMQ